MTPRIRHFLLIAASVLIPVLAVVQDAYGGVSLGTWGSIGVIAAGVVAVVTNISLLWKASDEEKALAKKIIAGIGTAASLAAPILTSVYTSLPASTKGLAFVGAVAGLAASLKQISPAEKPADNKPVAQQ